MDSELDKYQFSIDIPPRILSEETINELLIHMESHGGNDLFVMGSSEIWMALNGRKWRVTKRKISDKEAEKIIEFIYGTNAVSKLGEGKPLNPSYDFKTQIKEDGKMKTIRHRFRCNAVGCLRNGRKSMTVTLRTIPTTPPSVRDLGVEDEIVSSCRDADQGLVLVVGATGNGKSTLLASILRDQLEDPSGHRNLVTIEHPIEFVYDEIEKETSICTQLEVGRNIESFSEGVVNALRMAPTTILVGEARNYEEISAAINASVTGHVVFSTLHANSAAEVFQRMVGEYPEELQNQGKMNLIQSLKCIIAQRLIPTVDGKRTAIREYLIFNQKIKDYLLKASNITLAAFEMVEEFGKPMTQDVEDKYQKGIISKETYDRQILNYQNEKESA